MSDFTAPDLPDTPEAAESSGCHEPASSDTGSTYDFVDLDGDGFAETTEIDSNGDGEADAVLTDVDADHSDDLAAFDNTPGDGEFVPDVLAVAADGDGLADVIFDDTDLDGLFDAVLPGGDQALAHTDPYDITAGAAPAQQS